MSEATRRPVHVVHRDHAIAAQLLAGPQPLRTLAETLGLEPASAYRAVWRLRKDGHVEKTRDGSRTPTWSLTESGVAFANTPPATPQPPAEPVPVPAPVPEVPVV